MNTNNDISQEQLEAFERYFNKTMEPKERAEFDARIKEDPAFKILSDDTKLLLLGIENAALKSELDGFHEEMKGVIQLDPNKQKKGKSRFMVYSFAASIAILLGILWIFNSGSTSDKLYAKHFTPDPGLPTVMSTTDQYEFYDAMVDYKREKYSDAIQKWETLLPTKPNNDTLNYFLGVASLANGNDEKALNYLNKATSNSESFLKKDIYHYLGLVLLKKGNPEQAKENFIISGSKKSQQILLELK